MHVENLSNLGVLALPSFTRDDREVAVVIAQASFDLPRRIGDAPTSCDEQPEPAVIDAYFGKPGRSSLRREGQSTYHRPGTDVCVHGSAWAPRGRPAIWVGVKVRVGTLERQALVFGDRRFIAGGGRVVPSAPAPFERIPLIYEHAFGGDPKLVAEADRALAEHNPVGRGLYVDESAALDQPLANIEDSEALVQSPADRPQPVGFGPIARHWQPRRGFAGTYDEDWLDHRAPFWPADMDERMFCASAPGLTATPWLVGGEPVEIYGLHPDGAARFELPRLRLQAEFRAQQQVQQRALVLDAVTIDCEAWRLEMIWRASVDAEHGPMSFDAITLQVVETWEAMA